MKVITVISKEFAQSFTTYSSAAKFIGCNSSHLSRKLKTSNAITIKGFIVIRSELKKNTSLRRYNSTSFGM